MSQDLFSPPPSYSEQEFDRKILVATDLSTFDEDGWQIYNPKSFENISSVSTKSTSTPNSYPPTILPYEGTTSSSECQDGRFENQSANYWPKDKPELRNLPTTPLRIEKKIRPVATYSISNSTDAGTYGVDNYSQQPTSYPREDLSNFSSSSQAEHFANNFGEYGPPASSSTTQSDVYYEQIIREVEDENAAEPHSPAPPSFEEEDPSFSEIDPESIETPIRHVPVVADPNPRVPRPPNSSPLVLQPALDQGPDYSRNPPFDPYYHPIHPVSSRHSLPVPQSLPVPRSLPVPQPLPQIPRARPITSYQSPQVPLMNFNPSIAYGIPSTSVQPKLPTPPKANLQYDPHSFYNSSVSSKLTARRPLPGTLFQPQPNDLWKIQEQFPQQRAQMGTLGQPIPATFPQAVDNVRQTNIWRADRPVSTYAAVSTYSTSHNDPNQFPRYSVSPNPYYGNSPFAEQGGYNAR